MKKRCVCLSMICLSMIIVLSACSEPEQPVTNQYTIYNTTNQQGVDPAEQARLEAEEKARQEQERARKEAEEKTKREAEAVVSGFMDEFCVLNLKNMIEYTDAEVDYTQMQYLSLDEYKKDLLSNFTVFEPLGVGVSEFRSVVDSVIGAYSKYASYRITNSTIQGSDVHITVNAQFIRAETMEQIVDTAINRIDMEELESKALGSMVVSGLSGESLKGIVSSVIAPVMEELDMAVSRSIEELKPESGTLTFVVSEVNGKWVIRNNMGDLSVLSKVFERTTVQ